jgi:hypothetical protein
MIVVEVDRALTQACDAVAVDIDGWQRQAGAGLTRCTTAKNSTR